MAKPIVESATRVVADLAMKAPIRVLHVNDEANFLNAAKAILEMQGPLDMDTALSVEEV